MSVVPLLLGGSDSLSVSYGMEPEQERLSKLYSGSGIHSLSELNPNLNLHLKRQPVQNIFLHIYSWVDFDQF